LSLIDISPNTIFPSANDAIVLIYQKKDAGPILRSDISVFGLQLFFCKRKSQEMSRFPAAHFLAHYNKTTLKIGFQRKNHANFMHFGDVW
jgi:hypothetical protein